MCLSSGILTSAESMSTVECRRLNSNSSDQENCLDDYDVISSSTSTVIIQDNNDSFEEEEEECDSDYFAEFSWPEDSDNDFGCFDDDNNDDVYIDNHLNGKQLYLMNHFEEKNYQRSKRSNKKINAQRQIKTKYAQSIKIKSHNKQLYMHHRLVKKVNLDPPSQNCIAPPSPVPLYSSEALRSIIDELRHRQPSFRTHVKIRPPTPPPRNEPTNPFREYVINEQNIASEPSFDDAMIAFLLDMQNRDLSPEDYEMLLRLDERVQRKTIDTNILNTLPTVNVNETHLHEQCTICMETYLLGQQLKLLPCSHIFHSNCIETYLKEFSVQCPLDNLPLL